MSDTLILIIALVALIFISAFFSASETALMAVNRYRLRHLAQQGSRTAKLIHRLLQRPDRILGIILVGNTFANILASALATALAIKLYGEKGIAIVTIILTLIVLLFAEITPKTLAANKPQLLSFFSAWPLNFLLKIFYPLIWLLNQIANTLLKMLNVPIKRQDIDALNVDELRTLIHDSEQTISDRNQEMLLGILDLAHITVNEIMIPRHEIVGIDLEDDWRDIMQQLIHTQYTRLPVYHTHINQLQGILHVRDILSVLAQSKLDKEILLANLREPYFIPEHTLLSVQLLNFQKAHHRSAMVVDEYGDIQGLLVLDDILEEVVGQFTTDYTLTAHQDIYPKQDGTYLIDGAVTLRELKRALSWQLSSRGAKTLSGVIIEYLEFIPDAPMSLRIDNIIIEVVKMQDNAIKTVKMRQYC